MAAQISSYDEQQASLASYENSLQARELELRRQLETGTFVGSAKSSAGKKRRVVAGDQLDVPVATIVEPTDLDWMTISQRLAQETSAEERGNIATVLGIGSEALSEEIDDGDSAADDNNDDDDSDDNIAGGTDSTV